ncbi:MAG: T9SS type A sorting domain-containing protein, partial [Chitinophagales bacterium]
WQAISDAPITVFNILHSSDGVHFKQIGSVNGYDSGDGLYTYTHANPTSVFNYYRIQCADDQQVEFLSEIICIEAKTGKNNITLYPNPTTTYIVINDVIDKRTYQILNSSKQVIKNGELNENGKIDVHSLEAGIYYLQMDEKSYPFVKK